VRGALLAIGCLCTSVAGADPTPSPPRPPECKPSKVVLFEVDQRVDARTKQSTAVTRLFDGGAWSRQVFDLDGKPANKTDGCLRPNQLDSIRDELRRAKWKLFRSRITCRAYSPRYTVYTWKGRRLLTERICGPEGLDEDSRAALARIVAILRIPESPDTALECIDNPLAKGCN
jgi:hypothetical protein